LTSEAIGAFVVGGNEHAKKKKRSHHLDCPPLGEQQLVQECARATRADASVYCAGLCELGMGVVSGAVAGLAT
jgi:hypothetical protein